jgi:hypothetical protein
MVTVGTDSYVNEAALTAYATARGITLTADATVLLIKAMDYLETLNWQGEKTTGSQSLQWPRNWVYIDNALIDNATVPADIQSAQMATAISIDQGVDPLADVGPAQKRVKADVVEVEYQDGASTVTVSRRINSLIAKYLRSGGMFNYTVSRA